MNFDQFTIVMLIMRADAPKMVEAQEKILCKTLISHVCRHFIRRVIYSLRDLLALATTSFAASAYSADRLKKLGA